MTERDLFEQLIPQIAELIIEARKLSVETRDDGDNARSRKGIYKQDICCDRK